MKIIHAETTSQFKEETWSKKFVNPKKVVSSRFNSNKICKTINISNLRIFSSVVDNTGEKI